MVLQFRRYAQPCIKVRYVESFLDVIKAKYKAALMGEDTTSVFCKDITSSESSQTNLSTKE